MEAEAFLAAMKDLKLSDGRDRLVRHGHGPERTIQTGIGPVEVERVKIRDRAAVETASGSLHLGDSAVVGAADEELGRAFAGALLAVHLDGRLPGGAGGTSGPERTELVTCGDFPADGRVAGRVRALAEARFVGATIRLRLGRRCLSRRPAWKITASACWC